MLALVFTAQALSQENNVVENKSSQAAELKQKTGDDNDTSLINPSKKGDEPFTKINSDSNSIGNQNSSPLEGQPSVKVEKDLPQYHIQATLNPQKYVIRGNLELTAKNPGTDELLFYAYPYTWLPMKIIDVKLNDKEVDFAFDGKNLTFPNQKELKEMNVWIDFETAVPQKPTRFGVKDNVWLLTTWYPMLGVLDDKNQWIPRPDPIGMGDPFFFRYADYTVEWTSPASFKWLSSGHLEASTVSGKQAKTVWKVNQVRNFAFVGSPNYIVKKIKLNDQTTVSIALTDEKNFKEVEDIAKNTYPLFTKLYGTLPYSDVGIAETSYQTNYALEYPNLSVFSKDMYAQDQIQHWIPHEVGHTWWYNTVGVDETVNGWFDEGMVEHGVVWYLESRFSKEAGQKLWDEYRAEHEKLVITSPNLKMDVGLYGFKDFTEFDYSWYSRAADMFLTFRQALGDDRYIQFLHTLYTDSTGEIANEQSLDAALAKSLNLKTDFFSRWLHEPYSQTEWKVNLSEIQ